MVINIRGTGGSGKSTIVRRVMACYRQQPVYISGRSRPYGYRCLRDEGRELYVPGHYETACGGCDTITSQDEVYAIITQAADGGADVLFEGIIIQDDVRRCVALNAHHAVLVVGLRVPIEDCLASIRGRRARRGDQRQLNPLNTVNRAKRLDRIMARLAVGGVETAWAGRDEAAELILARLVLECTEGQDAAGEAPDLFQLR